MFFNQCQTTNPLELYNPNSKELLSNWEFKGKIQKTFDKELKCYTHTLDIGRLSKMSFPKSKSTSLNIVQTYIVFQIYLYTTKNFFIEIDFTDTENIKNRFLFSTNLRTAKENFFTSVIPIIELPIGKWINLSIDVLSFINSNISNHFKNKKIFKKIDYISISGSLKIRRIFTMRGKINDDLIENNSRFIEKINKNDKSYINDQYNNSEVIPAKFLIINNNVKVVNINMSADIVLNSNNKNNNNYNIYNNNFNNNNIEFFNVNESKISHRNYSKEQNDNNDNNNNNININNDNNNNNNFFHNNNLQDSSKKNKRYNLLNRGITNTNEPIVISTNTNQTNINGISNSLSSIQNSNTNDNNNNKISSSIINNKFNNNINVVNLTESKQINEMIQSKVNEFELDDKGLIYISKNENKNYEEDVKYLTQDMNDLDNNKNLNDNNRVNYINNNDMNFNNDNKINNKNLESSQKISELKNNILKNSSIEKIVMKESTNSRPYSPPLSQKSDYND